MTYESTESTVDYRKIFDDKMNGIKAIDEEEWATELASWYHDPEITSIRKEVPAVLFNPDNLVDLAPPTDIWIENPESLDCSSDYIHDQVKNSLGKFLGIESNSVPYLLAGYILESDKRLRYLVVDVIRASIVKKDSKSDHRQDRWLHLLDVLNKYKIEKVILKIGRQDGKNDTGPDEVIARSVLEERREGLALINLARKHGMTNNQYMRLKILADTLFTAGKQVSLEDIAKSIINEPDSVNINVKN